ncbi:MAG: MFS transporter [Sphingobacteriales bacterium]|nr:MAG: MFS transporter [Sphingobacteriales bacterium]
MQELNNKKIIRAWTIYDWANSVYSLVITSTIFPIYYNAVTSTPAVNDVDYVNFLGFQVVNTVLYSYALSFSFLLIAILSPILSGIADYSGAKKTFMKFFVILGSLACMGLYFFNGDNIEYGILCAVLASVGFGGSIVFYNSYLPEITTPENYDNVSARGFALGYIGSVILMVFNLTMVLMPQWYFDVAGKAAELKLSMPNANPDEILTAAKDSFAGIASRISFLTVGIWWFGFSQYTFAYLPSGNKKARTDKDPILVKGFRTLAHIYQSLKMLQGARVFLLAFFFYNMGVQTVMYLAATFGEKELHLMSSELITAILLIQIVAIAGAYLFAAISKRKGNILSISAMLLIWIGVCIGAYFVQDANQFFALAFVVGLIMGGIQSLSRSTYSKFLPEAEDHTSYFSFYDVAEKISIVLGTFMFGFAEYLTGSMRNSVLPLMLFFILGLVVLQFAKNPKLKPVKS